ncbi:nucleoporin NUP49/NSP49 [Purpureocillium lavendulum]|uniref:Nucleoporin NUP49/NSP49 n=1 Tax=Purpureocillium lavendulum TaxID=1247861 RepID=A0AB34FV52_9HYPO|nr:nucleoporin NUP49/NSP49 [Purpureocillium lavendulum]
MDRDRETYSQTNKQTNTMRALLLAFLSAAAGPALAALNEPCYGPNGLAGVCVRTASCASAGGTSIAGACPADAADVRCCSKPKCGDASFAGNCRWQSDCAGKTAQQAFCPGPGQFKCCDSAAAGFGGYPARPKIPPVGACKKTAVDGAGRIVDAFPGRVREVFCIRDCACPGSSDHCCGLATDMMCADGGGVGTLSGKEIAEWVMKNRAALNLKYVIWGQKIWSPTTDGAEKSWDKWRTMEDRGDLTQNHWDHVHVSYNG